VWDGGTCVPYTASDPVQADVVAIPSGVTWQWQITGVVDTSWDVDVYDVDVFDLDQSTYDALRADGRTIVCYFSAGSFEPWRDDAGEFPDSAIGKTLQGWPDERWLDVMDPTVRQIMQERLDYAASWPCDGVEPDNITAYNNRSGFGINATEQLSYNRFLADEAHRRGMGVAMKNDVEQVGDLIDWFDYTVNESCAVYDECDTLRPFVDADEAVLHTEYVDHWKNAPAKADEVCGIPGFSTIIKTWDLGPELQQCP